MIAFISLLALASGPLALEVTTPKQVFAGDEVPVVVRAKNVSNRPITIAKPTPPNRELGVSWKTDLLQEGKPLFRDERSHWTAQWMFGRNIREDHFIVLKPGESAEVYRDKFTWVLPEGKRRNTKREDAEAPRENLTPGAYTFRAEFTFERKFKEGKGALDRKMVEAARERYNQTWVGTITGETTFKVVEKPMATALRARQ